jgi:hypothetical protein
MGRLRYRCPRTSNEVVTGIDVGDSDLARLRNLKVLVSCPHCPEGHSVAADTMYFGATDELPDLMPP